MIEAIARRLGAALGVRHVVRVLESAAVDVPSVVGLARPAILIPASALTGLSPAQLEMILAHELAHIRRHDFLVNLLQTVVETLLFYHPAVWWVSRRIRAERELCADDLAAAATGDRVAYAAALASLESLRGASPAPSLGAGHHLLTRIQRLVEPDVAARPLLRGGLAMTVALLFLAVTLSGVSAYPTAAELPLVGESTLQSASAVVPAIAPPAHCI